MAIIFDPAIHTVVSNDATERMGLVRRAEDVTSILDAGKKEKDGGTLAGLFLRIVRTNHPDRLAYLEDSKAIREAGKKGAGLGEEIPAFLGIQADAMPEDVKALCHNRTAQAQFSQAKAAYLGVTKPKPNPVLAILGTLAKMDAATLQDALETIAAKYPGFLACVSAEDRELVGASDES